jgi:hypothetical protein
MIDVFAHHRILAISEASSKPSMHAVTQSLSSVTGNAAGNYAAPIPAKALGKREKPIALGIVRRAA